MFQVISSPLLRCLHTLPYPNILFNVGLGYHSLRDRIVTCLLLFIKLCSLGHLHNIGVSIMLCVCMCVYIFLLICFFSIFNVWVCTWLFWYFAQEEVGRGETDETEEHLMNLPTYSSFGEVSFLCNTPQLYTVRVRELCRLLRLDKQSFTEILEIYFSDGRIILNNLLEVNFPS